MFLFVLRHKKKHLSNWKFIINNQKHQLCLCFSLWSPAQWPDLHVLPYLHIYCFWKINSFYQELYLVHETYGLSLGVGFLTSSIKPDMFLRKRLWRCFSSMSFSLRTGLFPVLAAMVRSRQCEVRKGCVQEDVLRQTEVKTWMCQDKTEDSPGTMSLHCNVLTPGWAGSGWHPAIITTNNLRPGDIFILVCFILVLLSAVFRSCNSHLSNWKFIINNQKH